MLGILYKSYLQGINQLILLLYLAEFCDGSSLHRSLLLAVLCQAILELLEFVGWEALRQDLRRLVSSQSSAVRGREALFWSLEGSAAWWIWSVGLLQLASMARQGETMPERLEGRCRTRLLCGVIVNALESKLILSFGSVLAVDVGSPKGRRAGIGSTYPWLAADGAEGMGWTWLLQPLCRVASRNRLSLVLHYCYVNI